MVYNVMRVYFNAFPPLAVQSVKTIKCISNVERKVFNKNKGFDAQST